MAYSTPGQSQLFQSLSANQLRITQEKIPQPILLDMIVYSLATPLVTEARTFRITLDGNIAEQGQGCTNSSRINAELGLALKTK